MCRGVVFDNNQGPVTVNNENFRPRSTIIGRLVEIIATGDCESINLDRLPAAIENKIQFNNLKTYCWLVDEYINSSMLIDESIRELNQTILNGSTKLKRQMKLFYLEALSKFSICTRPFDLDKLKSNSDNIVKEVILLSTKFVKRSSDLKDGFFTEDINYGITLIVSYSIIECIVLENPNDYS